MSSKQLNMSLELRGLVWRSLWVITIKMVFRGGVYDIT